MKLAVAAIGQLKAGPEKTLCADYETRIIGLGRTAGFTGLAMQDWPEARSPTPELRKAEESSKLWNWLPEDGVAIALDERGKALSSPDFAKLLQTHASEGTRQLSFLIGGPDGHHPQTRTRARQTLSFGPMTYPHRLLRIMLLEQIYRAITILVAHPYHRA
jgi:23S rRNA (pseudouridine1915-N3)-methyltransferase